MNPNYQNFKPMNPNYQNFGPMNPNGPTTLPSYQNDDRLIGGFAFPFLLGGVTGAALAPNFWNRPYQPYYRPYPMPYPPYYGPYYR